MTHATVLEHFKRIFPKQFEEASIWFPNGRNSIRVRIATDDIIFTYNKEKDWTLETKDAFLKRMKGAK